MRAECRLRPKGPCSQTPNRIGGEGAELLLQGSWQQLTYLILSKNEIRIGDNKIGEKGVFSIVTAHLTKLQEINLSLFFMI